MSELVKSFETAIESDRRDIEAILENARNHGRDELTRAEDLRAEVLFTHMEQTKRNLDNALKEKAIDDAADAANRITRDNPGLPANRGDSHRTPNANDWLRSADGTIATVSRDQRFADHSVVRNELNRSAERDRHIADVYGDFGGWITRAMDTTTQSAVVPTAYAAEIIDLARNETVVMQAGATVVPMASKVEQVGRLTADATAYWKGEGSPITPSDLSVDYVQFTAKSMGALCVASMEFMMDAPNAGELIQNSIAKAMARKLDIQAFYGGLSAADPSGFHTDSADEPNAGIITELTAHAAGNFLGSAAADGTAITVATPFTELLDVVYAPRIVNEASTVLVTNVKMQKKYDQLYSTTQEHVELPGTVKGMKWLTTNAIPTFARGTKDHVSDIFAGDFTQLMVGMRLGVQLRFLTERYAENGQVGILAYFRGDLQIPRPAALAAYRYIQVEAN